LAKISDLKAIRISIYGLLDTQIIFIELASPNFHKRNIVADFSMEVQYYSQNSKVVCMNRHLRELWDLVLTYTSHQDSAFAEQLRGDTSNFCLSDSNIGL